MNEKLEHVAELMNIIKELGEKDAAYCIWNAEGVVEKFYEPKSFNVNFPVGFKVPDPNDALYTVLRTGEVMYNKIPKQVFGAELEGKIIPIFDGSEVVGAFTIVLSSDLKNAVTNNVNNLVESVEKTGNSINNIAEGAENLSANMYNVEKIAIKVNQKLEEAMEIVGEIKQNAKLSNILALNASIESARAGEAGKGFSIVSDEMRKFSRMSAEASEKINNTLSEINSALTEVKKSVMNSTEIATDQAVAVNELNSTFRDVDRSAKMVTQIIRESN